MIDIKYCKAGHIFEPRYAKGKVKGCKICHREQASTKLRSLGVPTKEELKGCKHGNDRIERYANGKTKGCLLCHREEERNRYHSDPQKFRDKALKYQKDHKDGAKRRYKKWESQPWSKESKILSSLKRRAKREEPNTDFIRMIMNDPCSYCGNTADSIDHIVPVSKGGLSEDDNLTAVCKKCNSSKNNTNLLIWLSSRPY